MLYVTETSDKAWRLVEDVSVGEYDESAKRNVLRSVSFNELASGDADDILLIIAGMGMGAFGENCISVLTEQGFNALVAAREQEVKRDAADYPPASTTREE